MLLVLLLNFFCKGRGKKRNRQQQGQQQGHDAGALFLFRLFLFLFEIAPERAKEEEGRLQSDIPNQVRQIVKENGRKNFRGIDYLIILSCFIFCAAFWQRTLERKEEEEEEEKGRKIKEGKWQPDFQLVDWLRV